LCSGYIHFTEKANGIKYLYASLDKHPDVFDHKDLVKGRCREGGGWEKIKKGKNQ